MYKKHRGSCHCGAVRFRCELDLAEGTSKGNCSICSKSRFWRAIVRAGAFRLVQGAEALAEYQFASRSTRHFFWKHCGIKTFGKGHLEALGGDFYAINVACLDDVTPEELAQVPVQFEDGKHDDWGSRPAEIRHL